MSAHQSTHTPSPGPNPVINLRTASPEDINAALKHWRGWRLAFDTWPNATVPTDEPEPLYYTPLDRSFDAELPGMWEQADLIDTSEAPTPAPDPAPDPTRIPAEVLDAAYHANNEALRRVQALTPGVHIPQTRTRTRPTPPTPAQRPPGPTETNETDFPGISLPANADKRLTEAIRLIALANKAPDNDSAIGHTLRALAQVISTIAVPRCCEGGPQWGHAWTCDTLP